MTSSTEIDKIAYIRVENGKILSTRSKGRKKYYIPGGKEKATKPTKKHLSERFEKS